MRASAMGHTSDVPSYDRHSPDHPHLYRRVHRTYHATALLVVHGPVPWCDAPRRRVVHITLGERHDVVRPRRPTRPVGPQGYHTQTSILVARRAITEIREERERPPHFDVATLLPASHRVRTRMP